MEKLKEVQERELYLGSSSPVKTCRYSSCKETVFLQLHIYATFHTAIWIFSALTVSNFMHCEVALHFLGILGVHPPPPSEHRGADRSKGKSAGLQLVVNHRSTLHDWWGASTVWIVTNVP